MYQLHICLYLSSRYALYLIPISRRVSGLQIVPWRGRHLRA